MSHAAPPASMPLRCREEAIEAQGRLMAAMSEAHEDQVDRQKAELACQKRKRMDVKAFEASKQLDMELDIKDLKKANRHLERANQELTEDNRARKSSRKKAMVEHVRLKDLYVELAAKQDRMTAKTAKAAAGYAQVKAAHAAAIEAARSATDESSAAIAVCAALNSVYHQSSDESSDESSDDIEISSD